MMQITVQQPLAATAFLKRLEQGPCALNAVPETAVHGRGMIGTKRSLEPLTDQRQVVICRHRESGHQRSRLPGLFSVLTQIRQLRAGSQTFDEQGGHVSIGGKHLHSMPTVEVPECGNLC